jgi:hypothetical protein
MKKKRAKWDKRVKIEPVISREQYWLPSVPESSERGQKCSVWPLQEESEVEIPIWENSTSFADLKRKMRRKWK